MSDLVQGPAQVRCQGTDGGDGLLLDLERLFPRSHLALLTSQLRVTPKCAHEYTSLCDTTTKCARFTPTRRGKKVHASGSNKPDSSNSTGYHHTHTQTYLAEASARLAGAGHVARQALVHLTGAHEEAYGYDGDRIR